MSIRTIFQLSQSALKLHSTGASVTDTALIGTAPGASGVGSLATTRQTPVISKISRNRKLNFLSIFLDGTKSILEIGCGDGWFCEQLRKMGHNVLGMDLVPPANIVGNVLDWKKLNMEPHSFDVVVALEVIEHVDCLAEMITLCRQDGIIFISTPHPDWDWILKWLENLGMVQKRTSPHLFLRNLSELPLIPLFLKRPLGVHQVGVFMNRYAARK